MIKYKLICTDCGGEYLKDEVEYVCPDCARGQRPKHPTLGILKIEYDYKGLKKKFTPAALKRNKVGSQERYIDLLPLDDAGLLPPLAVGPTPLEKAERLRSRLKLNGLFIKNDTCLPTGSFKDRASSVVVAKARELKKDIITTASTGNAATALAGMSASIGMKNVIFVPESAPKAKLTQIAMFGARLVPVKGTYDDAYALSIEATRKFGWYNRSTGFNPYTIEGKKTAALEIYEQLDFKAPDKVFIPTGDGVILSGTYKGFYDLMKLGLIERLPQIIPVQAEGSCAIVDAISAAIPLNNICHPNASTIADSICVSAPACGNWALKIVRETGGFGVKVTDDEIMSAEKELAAYAGIFAEPAAAAGFAGLIRSAKEGRVGPDDTVVVLITGTGLKDIPAAMKVIEIPPAIEPDIKNVPPIT
jgi:threonine synthase